MTAKEVSRYLRLPLSTVYYLAQNGSMPTVKFGSRYRFRLEDIQIYLHGESKSHTPSISQKKESSQEKRRHARFMVRFLTTIGDDEARSKAVITNISESGAYLSDFRLVTRLQPIRIDEVLPIKTNEFGELKVKVVRLFGRRQDDECHGRMGIGVEFVQLSGDWRHRLKTLVN